MLRTVTPDLSLICSSRPTMNTTSPMPETKLKIGLTRGLVDGGEIFAQFSLSSTAHYQHLFTYVSAICSGEKVLAVYWFSRLDREFVLIHDNATMNQCLANAGLHEILYVIAEGAGSAVAKHHLGYNSKPKMDPVLQLKTSSPSSGPSPDTANLEHSSEEDRDTRPKESIPLKRKLKKSPSLEWSYDIEQPPSFQELAPKGMSRRWTPPKEHDESAFEMGQRGGDRPTYYPYLEHYQPAYPPPSRPHRSLTKPHHNNYHKHPHPSGSMSDSDSSPQKEAETFLQNSEPPKRKKKAKRRANRAALEQKRQEIEMESFKEFASTVTADYLAEIFSKASHARRFIWVSVWLASFVYAWYNIALSINVFLSKPTATKLNFYEASPDGVVFPTVTLCNFNRFNKSYFDDNYNNAQTNKQLKDFLIQTTPIWDHKVELEQRDWDEKYNRIKELDIQKVLGDATHKVEDTVEFCRFSGKPCLSSDNQTTEVPSDAFQEVFTEHGLCYSFNQDGKMKMSRTGALYGLSLRLHVAQDDYFQTQDVAGFKVLLHNSYEPPMIEEYGFALRPGSESYVRIRLQKHKILSPFHEFNLLKGHDFVKIPKKTTDKVKQAKQAKPRVRFKDTQRPLGYCDPMIEALYDDGYTISLCVMENRAVNVIKKCKCIAFYMQQPTGYTKNKIRVCNLYQEWGCVDPLLEGLALGYEFVDDYRVLTPDCPSPCIYTTYSYTISQSEYPSRSVEEEILETVGSDKGDGWNIDRIRDNYLKVHIFFEELSTLEMERHPSYLISNLIGDVGGQLGLLLGMNICSLVQFSDYLIRASFFKGFMALVDYMKARRERAFVKR